MNIFSSASCCLCLSILDSRIQASSKEDTEDVLTILGNIFSVSEFFIDSLKLSKTPVHCVECTASLRKLHAAQSQEEGLRETVSALQKELCIKLRALAKVVRAIETERTRVHQEILKSERQLQSSGKRKDELMTKEVQSLRQLIMGALLLSSETPASSVKLQDGIKVSSEARGFPHNFVVCGTSEERLQESKKSVTTSTLSSIKLEADMISSGNDRSQDNEDVWNEFVVLNEEAAEPIEPDEIIFNDDDDEADLVSDCESEYVPPSKRGKRGNKRVTSSKSKSHIFELAYDIDSSDGDGDHESNSPMKKSRIDIGVDSTLTKQLATIAKTLKQHSTILDSLVAEKQLEVEGEPAGSSKAPKKQSSLLNILAQQARDLSELKAQVGNQGLGTPNSTAAIGLPQYSSTTHDFSQLPHFPIDEKSSLDSLEEWASVSTNRELLVAHLSLVGGSTLEKNIRRVLAKIFGKRLRTRINLTGKGGKIAFKNLQLHEVLKDTVRRQRPSAQETAITLAASNWFRYAKSSLTPQERQNLEVEENSSFF